MKNRQTRSLAFVAVILFALASQAQTNAPDGLLDAHRAATKADGLEGVDMILWEGTLTMPASGDVMKAEWLQAEGNRWQTVYRSGDESYIETFLGEENWTLRSQGGSKSAGKLTFEQIAPLLRSSRWGSPLLEAERWNYEVAYQGNSRQGTQSVETFLLTDKAGGGFMVKLNPKTGLIESVQDERVIKGVCQPVEIRFSDYREIWGTVLPFQHTYYQAGKPIMVFQFTNITFRPGIDPARWSLPVEAPVRDQISPDVLNNKG